MSAPQDSSLDDDDIAAIVNLNNEFFYTHFFDESDTNSDDDADLMVAVATVLNESNEGYMPQCRGSVKGRAANLDCNRENGHVQLCVDYFHPETMLYRNYFWRHFRMSRKLFGQIIEGVRLHDPYFRCKPDATGKLGFSSYQKCSAAIRMLAYGVAGDLVDEYMRMSESTYIKSMYNFYRSIITVFGEVYLREPNLKDTQRLLSINEKMGFPGMLGSIDCMHWEWKNYPFA
jgi:hypothetical protein